MGILLSALAAAGDSGVDSINQNIKQQNALDLESQRSELSLQKDKSLADYQNSLKNAPLTRLGIIAQAKAAEDIPVTAAPVTTTTGQDPTSTYQEPGGGSPTGLIGSIAANRALIAQIPDPVMRAQAQAQLDRQTGADNQSAQEAVAGQTRKRTTDEALNAALNDAKLSDMPAYEAGKGVAQDNIMKIGEGDTIYDRTTGKVLFSNNSKADRQAAHDDARADIEDARNSSHESIASDRMEGMLSRLGKTGQESSLTQNVKLLQSLGYGQDDIKNFIFNKKETSLDDLSSKILTSDPNAGTPRAIKPEEAVQKAIALRNAVKSQSGDATTKPPTTGKVLNYNPATGKVE